MFFTTGSSDYMTSTVGQMVNDDWKGFGRNCSRANCKTEQKYKNKLSIRIANDMTKIQTKYLLNIGPQYYCYTAWCLLLWCESSQRNETDNNASDDGHKPCKHMWPNYSHIGICCGIVQ